MKRKLDEHNVPVPVSTEKEKGKSHSTRSFQDLALDSRILQAIAKEGFASPTPVQAEAIPLALEGKDIFARSKTGSGKTAAYLFPILEATLRRNAIQSKSRATTSLILVPTRELAEQVSKVITRFSEFCAKDVRIANLTQRGPDAVQRSLLADSPDIVIATPSNAHSSISNSSLSLGNLERLVIDEADLVLSFGYEEDLQNIAKIIPKGVQTFLMSATLSTEVETLKGLFCRDPVNLILDEVEEEKGVIDQYVVKCAEDEKFLLIYVIFKLKLIKGKCIIFVADIDRCYRLKLFLEQFGTKSCVLNSELPVNSRIHVVEEFNKNVYDIIIATDEHEVLGVPGERSSKKKAGKEVVSSEIDTASSETNRKYQVSPPLLPTKPGQNSFTSEALATPGPKTSKSRSTMPKDKEYGISRGIDFHNVACVLNFDLPTTSKSYIHRIGRTARAGKKGMAISFVIPSTLYRKHLPTSIPSTEHDETVLAKITKDQARHSAKVEPYNFDMDQVNAFRYRMVDALRAVTRLAIREARAKELRSELLNSEKLARHFEENPAELKYLRHDEEISKKARLQPHLKHVPGYLLPNGGGETGKDVGFVGIGREAGSMNRRRHAKLVKRIKGKGGSGKSGKLRDPLKSFSVRKK